MLIDYHLHNHFSPDSEADSRELIEAEIQKGVKEICFTNHAEWFEMTSETGLGIFDYEEAVRRFESIIWEIEQLQTKFPSLPIKFGAEITFNTEILDGLDKILLSNLYANIVLMAHPNILKTLN